MDKGWGLTIDSDPVLTNFFPNKTNSGTGPFFRLKQQQQQRDNNMFQFPVSLAGSREDRHGSGTTSDDDQNGRRLAVDEVDFFSDKKRKVVDDDQDNKTISAAVNVKKETSHGDGGPASDNSDVNVSFFFSLNFFYR